MSLPNAGLQHYEGSAWNYPARPDPTSQHKFGVVDGDTFDLWMRVSPHSIETTRVRFLHISTAEIRFVKHDSEEYRKGIEHYRFVVNWFEDALERAGADGAMWPLFVRTSWSVGMRGRFLGDIYDYENRSLADDLVAEFGDDVVTPDEWHQHKHTQTDSIDSSTDETRERDGEPPTG